MTRNKTLVWLMWPVLILSFLFAGACSNGDTPTIPDGVLNLSDGGDIGQNELNALTTAYQTLKENHGGVQIVEDSEGYGLIGIMDRWTGASLSGTAVIQDNNGDLATVDINGSKLFSNVEWPITISVFVDGYVTQTLISTKANLFIFAMELTDPMNASIAVYAACQSYDSGGLIGGISPWRLTAVTTNNWDAWNSSEGQFFDAPFVVVRGNPYRNLGIVAFLMPPIFPGSGSTIAPPPPPAYGYFYKDLEWGPPGAITGWVFQAPETPVEPFSHEAGTWTINTSLFSEVQTAVLTFTGGGAKADGWQFVPYGLQTRVTVVTGDENNGVYNFDAYAPDVDADREVVEAKVRYPDGSSEIVYANWDPSDGSTLPDIHFGIPPVIDSATYNMLNAQIHAEWTNSFSIFKIWGEEEMGLLRFTVRSANVDVWDIFLPFNATGLPEDGLFLPNPAMTYWKYNTRALLTRIECPGIGIDNFDYDQIWTNSNSFATSAVRPFVDESAIVP